MKSKLVPHLEFGPDVQEYDIRFKSSEGTVMDIYILTILRPLALRQPEEEDDDNNDSEAFFFGCCRGT